MEFGETKHGGHFVAEYIRADGQRYTAISDLSQKTTPLMPENKYKNISDAINADKHAMGHLATLEMASKKPDFNYEKFAKEYPAADATVTRIKTAATDATIENMHSVRHDIANEKKLGTTYAVKGHNGTPVLPEYEVARTKAEAAEKARDAAEKSRAAEMQTRARAEAAAKAEAANAIDRAKSGHPAPATAGHAPTQKQPLAVASFHGDSHSGMHMNGVKGRNNVDVAFESFSRGDSMGVVATEVGKAAVFSTPVLGAALQQRYTEAAIQLAARLATPLMATGVGAVAITGLEIGARKLAKEFGADVNDQAYTVEIAKGLASLAQEAIRKIPMPLDLMRANTQALSTQAGLLEEAAKGTSSEQKAALQEILRDPQRSGPFIAQMKENAQHATNPKARADLGVQAEAAEQFAMIEKNRMAKLEPYTKQLSTEIAALTKAHGQGQQQTTHVAAKTEQQLKAGANLPDNVKGLADRVVAEAKTGEPNSSYVPNQVNRDRANAAARG